MDTKGHQEEKDIKIDLKITTKEHDGTTKDYKQPRNHYNGSRITTNVSIRLFSRHTTVKKEAGAVQLSEGSARAWPAAAS